MVLKERHKTVRATIRTNVQIIGMLYVPSRIASIIMGKRAVHPYLICEAVRNCRSKQDEKNYLPNDTNHRPNARPNKCAECVNCHRVTNDQFMKAIVCPHIVTLSLENISLMRPRKLRTKERVRHKLENKMDTCQGFYS